MTFQLESEGVSLSGVNPPTQKTLAFGVRICDAKSLAITDVIFREVGDRKDDFYTFRRENTTLITLFCDKIRPTCRCGAYGSIIEAAKVYSDAVVTPLEEEYIFDVITDKGAAALEIAANLFSSPSEEQLSRRDAVQKATEEALNQQPQITPIEREVSEVWEHPVWERIGRRCIACGICTYLCPCCTCFDILDECPGIRGRRYKCWDTCQFPQFTLQASGHNPRANQAARLRQRILHKWKYQPDTINLLGCTGCGRCLELCPVSIRFTEILAELKQSGESVESAPKEAPSTS